MFQRIPYVQVVPSLYGNNVLRATAGCLNTYADGLLWRPAFQRCHIMAGTGDRPAQPRPNDNRIMPVPQDTVLVRVLENANAGLLDRFVHDWLPSVIALAVVFIGGLFQWLTAKRQLIGTTRSNARLEWISTLRKEVAQVVRKVTGIQNTVGQNQPISTKTIEELHQHYWEVKLALNPARKDQQALADALFRLVGAVEAMAQGGHFGSLQREHDEVAAAARTLFQNQWERVKAMD